MGANSRRFGAGVVLAALVLGGAALWRSLHDTAEARVTPAWTAEQVGLLKTLDIDTLRAAPDDPSNAYATDPDAAELGRRLFSDARLSAGSRNACASCHRPHQAFADGRRVAKGLGEGRRNTPTLIGAAWGRWFNWDGRSDSLWAQALGPLEASAEMGFTRGQVVHLIAADADYRARFEMTFGPIDPAVASVVSGSACGPTGAADAMACWQRLPPDSQDRVTRAFVDVAKALAAYQATLRPKATRFDRFVRELAAGRTARANAILSSAEQRGLRLFIDPVRSRCINCHNGPLLTNGGFHDIGTNLGFDSAVEMGRMLGARALEASEFGCTGRFSDALPAQCVETRFARSEHAGEGRGAFKVPTLRNVARTSPYGHDGRFATLHAVIAHYRSPSLSTVAGAHELRPLELSDAEVDDLVRFLGTLDDDAGRRRASVIELLG